MVDISNLSDSLMMQKIIQERIVNNLNDVVQEVNHIQKHNAFARMCDHKFNDLQDKF